MNSNAQEKLRGNTNKAGLELLREPFAKEHISKLPKPTRAQTEALKANYKAGIRCLECGGWHHKDVIHLDYVGHAALTNRLLDADPEWSWDFLALDESGLPRLDGNGGLWITLTVCGVTRKGYGDAPSKTGGDAMKERIGDAMRNAAMRFGAALDLWHKGDLHTEEVGHENVTPIHSEKHKKAPGAEESLYPQSEFEKNLPAWKRLISNGRKTNEEIINFLIKNGSKLSDKQKQSIIDVPTIQVLNQ